ncbi:MAG: aquaporin family protein [Nitrospirae bacterium]|nr:aquaporin family protein [Nitrospirota bacterium]
MTMLARRLAAEGIGTALLLATIVGSGIMGERLSGVNTAIALLANSLATGAGLIALILTFGPISGAHFNPLVTLAGAIHRTLPWRHVPAFIAVQVSAAFLGVAAAHLMFGEALFSVSQHIRSGFAQAGSECLATFGLISVILGCSRRRTEIIAFAVGCYIMAAYWFTASTSFANPAVTLARSATNSFAGIRPEDTGALMAGQLLGATAAVLLFRWLDPLLSKSPQNGHDRRKMD